MLKIAAPFPQVGSYALLVDDLMPIDMQRAELVRIQYRQGDRLKVSWPLRIDASGYRSVAQSQLIDGTPLTGAEQRELTDLLNAIRGRARPNKAKVARSEALRSRLIYSRLLAAELEKLGRLKARQQPSIGSHLPRHAA